MKTAPVRTIVRKLAKKKTTSRKLVAKKPKPVPLPYSKFLRDEALNYQDTIRFDLGMHNTECCGIKEFTGMSSMVGIGAEVVVANLFRKMLYAETAPAARGGIKKEIATYLVDQLPVFALFTEVTALANEVGEEDDDVDYYEDGETATNYLPPIIDFINNTGLGSVTETPEAVNPNTGNTIRAVIWQLDRAELVAWWNKVGRFYTV